MLRGTLHSTFDPNDMRFGYQRAILIYYKENALWMPVNMRTSARAHAFACLWMYYRRKFESLHNKTCVCAPFDYYYIIAYACGFVECARRRERATQPCACARVRMCVW